MGLLKKFWRVIAFGVVCLASLGAGGWAYLGGATVLERMERINSLRNEVEGAKRNPANRAIIEQRKKEVSEANSRFEQAMGTALTLQKQNAFESHASGTGKTTPVDRAPILKNVLPAPTSSTDAHDFREAYKKAHAQLALRMKGRGKASGAEVADYEARMKQLKQRSAGDVGNPWGPSAAAEAETPPSGGSADISKLLSQYSKARATEELATGIYAWVDDRAFGRHLLADSEEAPKEADIWQAQMALWIQQDIAHGLALSNEERATKLKAQNQADRCWVAYMPVKRLITLRIDNRLGKGGGMNLPRDGFALSFTGLDNNGSMFVVPLQIEMVVEEASMMQVISKICSVGFYTPISISYRAVKPNPLQDDFIYGEDPVVEVILDLEAYYFRKVYDPWIPKDIKPILARPGAVDDSEQGGGRG